MNQEQKNKYERLAKITGIVIGLILVLGISYAVFKTTTLSDKTNEISAGKLDLRIDHEEDEILLENAVPITEEEGLKQSPYVFDVVNEGTIEAAYDLYIEVDEEISTLPTSVVRYYLTVEEDNEEKIVTSRSRIIGQEEVVEKEGKKLYKIDRKYIDTNKTNKYKLYLWIDNEATVEKAANKYFEARVAIEGEQIYDKNRLVKQIDVSELGDNSVIAYMYADGRVVLKGKGTIASNLSNTLVYDKEGVLDNYKKILLAMGCNEEEVNAITTIEELDEYFNTFTEEDWNNFYVIQYKEIFEEIGYDTSSITDFDSLMTYMMEQGWVDEEGNNTEQGDIFFEKLEKNFNDKYDSTPKAPSRIELEDGITNIPNGLFTGNEDIKEVVIPASVTKIDNNAFYNCRGLTNIILPNTVTSIGDYAFYGCTGIKEIALPNNLTKIGNSAFSNCKGLTSIAIPNSVTSIESSTFSSCTALTSIEIPNGVTSIGSSAFNRCTNLSSIKLSEGLTRIDSTAFSNCTSLLSITIPESVTSMGVWVFENCTSLETIKINGNLSSASNIFSNCSNLTNVEFGEKVTMIPDSMFERCTGLTSIDLPKKLTSIGKWAFENCTNLTSVTIPDNITSIGDYAFKNVGNIVYNGSLSGDFGARARNGYVEGKYVYKDDSKKELRAYCGYEENIKIEDSVTTIGNYAFYMRSSLTSIEIPESVTKIGYSSFNSCTSLLSIKIPNSVTAINDSTFAYCTSLISIELPKNLTNIGSSAFENCRNLTNIVIPDSVIKIGLFVFRYCTSLTSIEIPNSVTNIYAEVFEHCTNLKAINVSENNSNYASVDGVLYNKNKDTLIRYPENKEGSSYSILSSVTKINSYAFRDCENLTSIEIPNSVTRIENYAFLSCKSIKKITIPNSVEYMSYSVFTNWESNQIVNIDNTKEFVDSNWNSSWKQGSWAKINYLRS